MRFIADLHIHSRFSRACSKQLTLLNIDFWCRKKGINLVGTGDFTHPQWFREMRDELTETEHAGFYRLKAKPNSDVYFLCTAELSCIYTRGGRGRRVHHIVLAPSLEVVEKINQKLEARGFNLKSDGRPILGIDSEDLLKFLLEINERILLIPAHAWTPWFAVFGSESGFDSLEECFGDMAKHVYAIETGLSSDPLMNWRLSGLDRVLLMSNSDAHSLPNLGREVNILESAPGVEPGYNWLAQVIREKDTSQFLETVEFFPEEGKYHFDGHRACGVRWSPKETKKNKGICPVCKKDVTVGVMHRIDAIADREEGIRPKGSSTFRSMVPLGEIIAETLGVRPGGKAVLAEYERLVEKGGSEFSVLLDKKYQDLSKIADARVVEAVRRVREGKLTILPGYDGEYGTVKIFSEAEQAGKKGKQKSLF